MKKGLIIKEPWISLILMGKKTWEIRNTNTKTRGKIYLIKSKSGMIFGEANLVDCIKINKEIYENNRDKHYIGKDFPIYYDFDEMYAWILENPIEYKNPIPYNHKKGCVRWINIDED